MEERYVRNVPALTPEEQQYLADSQVCVVGCGGLGGYLIEYLARVGVGTLRLIDGDSFEPSNLNRQLLCMDSTLGMSKAAVAAQRAHDVNPSTCVQAMYVFLNEENADTLLEGTNLVLDALDSIPSRRILAATCRRLSVPFIHGAIQGWNAQIAVCMPSGSTLEQLYPDDASLPEQSSLSFTPALCAAIQCAEAVKILTGKTASLESRLLLADLRYMNFKSISIL